MRLRPRAIVAAPRIYHGLGNRLRVVLGARSLAQVVDREFAYVWPTGPRFGADFTDLWEFQERKIPQWISGAASVFWPYQGARLDWLEARAQSMVWQIRTAHALHLPPEAASWGKQLRSLSPVPDLAQRITTFRDAHLGDAPYVGVMVRTHPISNEQTLRHSPLSWFISRMREIRDQRPDILFFVSADTEQGQRKIAQEFPDARFLEGKGPYNSPQALRSSIVDLYLLAGATHILGPHYSSFPEIAEELANFAVRLETSMTPTDRVMDPSAPMSAVVDPLRPDVRIQER